MDARALTAKAILSVFVLAALFGVYGMLDPSHSEHGGCPTSPAQHMLCATPLEHLGHWQAVFTGLVAQILILLAAVIIIALNGALVADTLGCVEWRQYRHIPRRPTTLQELFSQGILHRKEPQIA